MELKVDKEICIGCGSCYSCYDEVMTCDENGQAEVKSEATEISEELAEEIKNICPVDAIKNNN